MEQRFWGNKAYVKDWLNNLEGFDYSFSANTIGPGHRGIKLFVFDVENVDEFMDKYGSGESRYAKFWLTKCRYTDGSPFYVSIKKK